MLFPFVKDETQRDVMMNTVAPVWDGNETWLVLGGACLFGAFPLAYAVVLDALSIPLLLMLIGLIFRGVAFEFRFKSRAHEKHLWDKAFIGECISVGGGRRFAAIADACGGINYSALNRKHRARRRCIRPSASNIS